MFIQEKKYISLWKAAKKICEAGLVKLSVRDNRIKVEYFLNDLPLYDGCEAKCVIAYSISQEDKRRAISEKYLGIYEEGQKEEIRNMEWDFKLFKRKPQYCFQMKALSAISRILSCEVSLQGNYKIQAEGMENAEPQSEIKEQEKKVVYAANLEAARPQEEDIRYVEDLTELLKYGTETAELYHNSFLLHGFYQYRHFLFAEQFIGVPGNFHEREAVAAKMLGFPYFIEAEHVRQCRLDGELRRELPANGAFGYYLCAIKGKGASV